jgi:Flp pilus assembly protein TadD
MKHEFKIKGNLARPALARALENAGCWRSRKERKEKLYVLNLYFIRQYSLNSFFATLRLSAARSIGHSAKTAFLFCLGFVLVVFFGCATAKVKPEAGAQEGPSVARLADGRQGFVIQESPGMDAESRAEFKRAVALIHDGKNDEAIELLTKVIERSPGVTAPYIDLAEAYMRVNKLEPAEQNLKTALGLVPNHPVASNEYGLLLRKSGRFKEAREIYETALASFPEYFPIHRNLGILCDLYLNDPECALKQFEIYSEAMPADGQVKIWIAELHTRLGR